MERRSLYISPLPTLLPYVPIPHNSRVAPTLQKLGRDRKGEPAIKAGEGEVFIKKSVAIRSFQKERKTSLASSSLWKWKGTSSSFLQRF